MKKENSQSYIFVGKHLITTKIEISPGYINTLLIYLVFFIIYVFFIYLSIYLFILYYIYFLHLFIYLFVYYITLFHIILRHNDSLNHWNAPMLLWLKILFRKTNHVSPLKYMQEKKARHEMLSSQETTSGDSSMMKCWGRMFPLGMRPQVI